MKRTTLLLIVTLSSLSLVGCANWEETESGPVANYAEQPIEKLCYVIGDKVSWDFFYHWVHAGSSPVNVPEIDFTHSVMLVALQAGGASFGSPLHIEKIEQGSQVGHWNVHIQEKNPKGQGSVASYLRPYSMARLTAESTDSYNFIAANGASRTGTFRDYEDFVTEDVYRRGLPMTAVINPTTKQSLEDEICPDDQATALKVAWVVNYLAMSVGRKALYCTTHGHYWVREREASNPMASWFGPYFPGQ